MPTRQKYYKKKGMVVVEKYLDFHFTKSAYPVVSGKSMQSDKLKVLKQRAYRKSVLCFCHNAQEIREI